MKDKENGGKRTRDEENGGQRTRDVEDGGGRIAVKLTDVLPSSSGECSIKL